MLVEAEPEIFRLVPGGWGKHGATNVRLSKADAKTLAKRARHGLAQHRAEIAG